MITKVEDTRLSFRYITVETTTHVQPYLVNVYLVATWTKLYLRHTEKMKAIYTNDTVDQKEQSFPNWLICWRATGLTSEASQGTHVVSFENPSVYILVHATQNPSFQRGGLCCADCSTSPLLYVIKIQVLNVRLCFTLFLNLETFRVSLVCIDNESHCFLHLLQKH